VAGLAAEEKIEWLVRQRFGVGSSPPRNNLYLLTHPHESIEKCKSELRAMSAETLQKTYADANEAVLEIARRKADEEEQARFFNQPHNRADFHHWSRASYWKIEEAVALALGRAPVTLNGLLLPGRRP